MNRMKSPTPTHVNTCANLLRMVWLFVSQLRSILELVFERTRKLGEKVVTWVPVNEKVRQTLVCPEKFFGWEDSVFCVVFWRSIELRRRLTTISIELYTWRRRVTFSKISEFWWNTFTRRRPKTFDRNNWLTSRKPTTKGQGSTHSPWTASTTKASWYAPGIPEARRSWASGRC